jgi:Peptidase A4 family
VHRRRALRIVIPLWVVTFALGGSLRPAFAETRASEPTDSSLYGGYVITSAPDVASAAVRFTVPDVTCSNTTQSGLFIGADVMSPNPFVDFWEAGVDVMCENGVPTYKVVFAWGSGQILTDDPVNAGDSVMVLARLGPRQSQMRLKNITKNYIDSISKGGGTTQAVVVGITPVYTGSVVLTALPVPQFGAVTLKYAKEDSITPGAEGAQQFDLTKDQTPPVVQVQTGPLNSAGNSWTELFKHS